MLSPIFWKKGACGRRWAFTASARNSTRTDGGRIKRELMPAIATERDACARTSRRQVRVQSWELRRSQLETARAPVPVRVNWQPH